MLFLCNSKNYIFIIEPSAHVDLNYLKAKGCEFFETIEQLYQKSADVQNLTVEEVEGCEFTVLFSKLRNEIACIDQRNCGMKIEGRLEDFIADFHY